MISCQGHFPFITCNGFQKIDLEKCRSCTGAHMDNY